MDTLAGCLGIILIPASIFLVSIVISLYTTIVENLHIVVDNLYIVASSIITIITVAFLYRHIATGKYLRAGLLVAPLGLGSALLSYIHFSRNLPPVQLWWTPPAPVMQVYSVLAPHLHLIVPGLILAMTLNVAVNLLLKRSLVQSCVLVLPLGLTLALCAHLYLVGAFAANSTWTPPAQVTQVCVWLVDNMPIAAPLLVLVVSLIALGELLLKRKPPRLIFGALIPLGIVLALFTHFYFTGALTQGKQWTPPAQVTDLLARWQAAAVPGQRRSGQAKTARHGKQDKRTSGQAGQTAHPTQAASADTGRTFADSMSLFNQGRHKAAFALFRQLAEQGHVEAQYWAALCYESGQGTTRNAAQKARWYAQAAAQNYAPAQYKLALCYQNGAGIQQDTRLAFTWMKLSAEAGFKFAQYDLGLFYAQGFGTTKDTAAAKQWLQRAAQQGLSEAQDQLRRLGETR